MNFIREIRERGFQGIAVVCDERQISYKELFDYVAALRESFLTEDDLAKEGVLRVGVRIPDGLGHLVVALAVLEAGACFVPIAEELSDFEQSELAREAGLDCLITVKEGCEGLSREELFVSRMTPQELTFSEEDFAALNPAFIRYSSGTTGASKGVILSHETIRERVLAANQGLQLVAGDRVAWTLSMAHHFVVTWMLYLDVGVTVVLVGKRSPEELVRFAGQEKVTVMYSSPFHFAELSQVDGLLEFESLRLAISTTAALTPDVAAAFEKRFQVSLTQALGIIEVGLPIMNGQIHSKEPSALGQALPDYELQADGEGGQGELMIRGPGLLDAYLKPWRIRDEILDGGWFRTGDIVRTDAQENWFLMGRCKSVLNVGGMKVFPEEVEAVINGHESVHESRVSGAEHPVVGVFPQVEVVLKQGVTSSEAELRDYCIARLASYKLPLNWIFVDFLARTSSGKLLRV